jgi:transposase
VWGAHYWAREIVKLGHQVKLMSPRYVRAYVKSNKTDARDAEAICEAVGRPSMRVVEVKSQAQQEVMAHRVRAQLIRERISCRAHRDRFNFEGSLRAGVQFLRDAILWLIIIRASCEPVSTREGWVHPIIPKFDQFLCFVTRM